MTPTTAELLQGVVVTLSTPLQAEDMALFMQGRLGVIALVSLLAAQEAERGAAVRAVENADLRALLAAADPAHTPPSSTPDDLGDGDLSMTALDAANAALRRRLTALHAAVEAAGDRDRDLEILAFYRRMAAGRALALPTPAAAV